MFLELAFFRDNSPFLKFFFASILVFVFFAPVSAENIERSSDRAIFSISGKVYIQQAELSFTELNWPIANQNIFSSGQPGSVVQAADFNGDGCGDILLKIQSSLRPDFLVGLSDCRNGFSFPSAGAYTITVSDGINAEDLIVSADFNADSCADLVVFSRKSKKWYFLSSTCKTFIPAVEVHPLRSIGLANGEDEIREIQVGDTSGDGLGDLLLAKSKMGPWYYAKYIPQNQFQYYASLKQLSDRELVAVGNFDGDNLDEVVFRLEKQNVFGITPSSRLITTEHWAEFPILEKGGKSVVGDFNGDGLSDILLIDSRLTGSWVAFSNRVAGLEAQALVPQAKTLIEETTFITDLNGDGVDDILASTVHDNKILVLLTKPGVPLANSVLTLNCNTDSPPNDNKCSLGEAIRTNAGEDGSYRFDNLKQGEYLLKVEAEKYLFYNKSRKLNVKHSKQNINFSGKSHFAGNPILDPEQVGPFVCLGYTTRVSSKWSLASTLISCPEGYGIYELNPAYLDDRRVLSSCCRLPSPDIFTAEESIAEEQCPEGSVVVGNAQTVSKEEAFPRILCRRINLKRYQLGAPLPAVYWGADFRMDKQEQRIAKANIPSAIRYGTGRLGYNTWRDRGCIGYPYGSLLVSRNDPLCQQVKFRQLEYTGLPGDPPKGTAVKMFPDCTEIDNIFDPTTGCKEP